MIDSFLTALKSLWANKLRSFLTLLGIVIGIYAVVTLLSVAEGIQKQISDQVEGLGPRAMIILPGETEEGAATPNFASQFAPSTLFVDDVKYLADNTSLIEKEIDYAVFVGGLLKHKDKSSNALPLGGTLSVAKFNGLKELKEGRVLEQADIDNKNKVIFLTEKTAKKLEASVGDQISLGSNKFELKGIYFNPENGDLTQSTEIAIIPVTVANELNRSQQIARMLVNAVEVNQVDNAKAEITEVLKKKHGSVDFTVITSTELLGSVTSITDILKYAVVGIAAISLLVGGIGISNIMLVTVTERTREIGLRKAVGATEGAIMLQFLIESVVLTVIGALIGIGMALVTTTLAAKYSPLEPFLSTQTMVLALAMGAISGIIFGLFPAFRAARKNPVEALRFE